MNPAKFLFVTASALCFFVFTGCGDANPLSTKTAVSIVRKTNTSMENRAPELVVEQFLDAFAKADFDRAEMYCEDNARAYLKICKANQRLQEPKDKKFWDDEFTSFTANRLGNLQLQDAQVDIKTEKTANGSEINVSYAILTYIRPASAEILMSNNRPQVIEIATALFQKNEPEEEKKDDKEKKEGSEEDKKEGEEEVKEEVKPEAEDPEKDGAEDDKEKEDDKKKKKKTTIIELVQMPEQSFQFFLRKNENNVWMITDVLGIDPNSEKDKADAKAAADADQAFMDLAAEEETKEKKTKEPEKKEATGNNDSVENIDFGFN